MSKDDDGLRILADIFGFSLERKEVYGILALLLRINQYQPFGWLILINLI